MTKRRLTASVVGEVIYLVAYAIAAAWAHACAPTSIYVVIKDCVAVAVAVPAAILAGIFQRRNSYLQALRDYWTQIIPAVQASLQYTFESAPTQAQFATVYVGLSSAIDITRSVFANVRTGHRSGLYPFENLKDILE